MSSKFLFPTIDTDGWAKSSIKVADYMLSHFFLSEFSQTAHFPNNVFSFPHIAQKNIDDPVNLASEIQSSLTSYFLTQFSNVEVEASDIAVTDQPNKRALMIYMSFQDSEGVSHSLSRLANYAGSKVLEIKTINNG